MPRSQRRWARRRAPRCSPAQRVERAFQARDIDQIIGSAKDLIECVAKVVVQSLGGSFANNANLPGLGAQALQMLGVHPQCFQDRDPLRILAKALAPVPGALGSLRNHEGTGHGRPVLSDLAEANAVFVGEIAAAWSRLVLAALGRVLAGMEAVQATAQAIEDLGHVLYRGDLRRDLDALQLSQLEPLQQHQLGVAVGRRSAAGTRIANLDVIEPLAQGIEQFPEPFAAGVIEGLFIDRNGYIRTHEGGALFAAAIAQQLGVVGADVLTEICTRMDDTDLSYGFDPEIQATVIEELRGAAEAASSPQIEEALRRMGVRIEALSEVPVS
jgi:hypothetical protein